MVFLRFPFLSAFKTIKVDADQLEALKDGPFTLYHNGKRVDQPSSSALPETAHVDAVLRLVGGKGGFGAMLRALGAQIDKTTNREACRDLSGRRLRDVNEEDRLRKYVAKQADREQEAAEKKEAKLAKLRKIAKGENKHEFHDPKYAKEREESTSRVHDAMEKAFEAAKPSTSSSSSSSKPSTSTSTTSGGVKRKKVDGTSSGGGAGPSAPKKGLWIGDGLTESDLEDSSDEDEEAGKKVEGKGVSKAVAV